MKKLSFSLMIMLLCLSLLCGCAAKSDEPVLTTGPATTEDSVEDDSMGPGEPLADFGADGRTLLESGSGLNENYYNDVDYFGAACELTGNSFIIGKCAMAFGPAAQPVVQPLKITYTPDTVVKAATLQGDKYGLYSADISDLAKYLENIYYTFDIILDNPDSGELVAKEIRIARYIVG